VLYFVGSLSATDSGIDLSNLDCELELDATNADEIGVIWFQHVLGLREFQSPLDQTDSVL